MRKVKVQMEAFFVCPKCNTKNGIEMLELTKEQVEEMMREDLELDPWTEIPETLLGLGTVFPETAKCSQCKTELTLLPPDDAFAKNIGEDGLPSNEEEDGDEADDGDKKNEW